jgi:hypothetical protein
VPAGPPRIPDFFNLVFFEKTIYVDHVPAPRRSFMKETDSRDLLILADGLRFGPSNLPLVVAYFESIGFVVELVPFTFEDFTSVEIYGMHVGIHVAAAAKRHPHRKRYLFGFSMGGLAVLDAIKNDGIARLLDGAGSYGTPYQGSFLATIGAPLGYAWRLVSQLRLRSPYLRRLQGRPMPKGFPYTSFAGDRDMICPARLCHLKGAENITIAGGHTSFLYYTDLLDRIAARLRRH